MDTPSFSDPAGGVPPSAAPPLPPPPVMPPPPVILPPAPSAPRRSWGWMVTAIILFILLFFAGLITLGQFVSHSLTVSHNFKSVTAREVGPKLDECILQDGTSRNKIAVITVDGIITGHTSD